MNTSNCNALAAFLFWLLATLEFKKVNALIFCFVIGMCQCLLL